MWCERCQQDVPGVAVLDAPHEVVCPRCRGTLHGAKHPLSPLALSPADSLFELDLLDSVDLSPNHLGVARQPDWEPNRDPVETPAPQPALVEPAAVESPLFDAPWMEPTLVDLPNLGTDGGERIVQNIHLGDNEPVYQEFCLRGDEASLTIGSFVALGINDPPQAASAPEIDPDPEGELEAALAAQTPTQRPPKDEPPAEASRTAPRTAGDRKRTWEDDAAELERLLAELDVLVQSARPEQPLQKPSSPQRVDAGHRRAALAGPHFLTHAEQSPARTRLPASASQASRPFGWASWLVLSLGLMLFMCGGVLLAWSLIAGRDELWRVGLPLTLAGQVVLLLGLALQLDSLWTQYRQTTKALKRLQSELQRIEQQAASEAEAARTTPAQSYFLQMAEKASPHLLIADLKGQIDLLTRRLARDVDDSGRAA